MSVLLKLKRTVSLSALIFRGMRKASRHEHLVQNGIPSEEYQRIRQQWLTELCEILPLTIEVEGDPIQQTALWVANHISWMDIPVIGSLAPVGFLSKAEISQWPLVGKLAARSGTLFIERGGNSAAARAVSTIEQHLQHDHSILFFPEGTTTDGSRLRTFHPRLLAAAIDHGHPIQPVSLSYFDPDGCLSKIAPYIDNATFQSSYWNIIGASEIRVVVRFMPPVTETAHRKRKELASELQAVVGQDLGRPRLR